MSIIFGATGMVKLKDGLQGSCRKKHQISKTKGLLEMFRGDDDEAFDWLTVRPVPRRSWHCSGLAKFRVVRIKYT